MSYRDSLAKMNLDEGVDIVFSYTTQHDVWFTEDTDEHDAVVNQTDLFDVWWKMINTPNFEYHLKNALLDAVEYVNIETEEPNDFDLTRAYQAFKDKNNELCEFCNFETVRHDYKRGFVRGTWELATEWVAIQDNEQFWQILNNAKGRFGVSVYTDNGVVALSE